MYHQIREDLHLPLGCLFVNRTHHAEFCAGDVDRLEQASASLRKPEERAIVEEAISRGREEVGWSEIHRQYLQRLMREVDMPVVEVPFIFADEFGAAQVRSIADTVAAKISALPRRGHKHGRA